MPEGPLRAKCRPQLFLSLIVGLIIDCYLKWKKKHTNEVGEKISRDIGILFKLRHLVIHIQILQTDLNTFP